ncbi:MAG: hypothetical protein ACRDZ8_10200 [Acidimicrobiales bacterium]
MTTTTPPTTAVALDLALDHPSVAPGGSVTASGQGCLPGSVVQLSIGSTTVGTTTADTSGRFSAPLSIGTNLGQFTVVAQCGVTLRANLSVVLNSHANTPTSTAAILLVMLLALLALLRWSFVR